MLGEISDIRLQELFIPKGMHMRMKGISQRKTNTLRGIPFIFLKSRTISPIKEATMLILKTQ